jgi:hypothetical protein
MAMGEFGEAFVQELAGGGAVCDRCDQQARQLAAVPQFAFAFELLDHPGALLVEPGEGLLGFQAWWQVNADALVPDSEPDAAGSGYGLEFNRADPA